MVFGLPCTWGFTQTYAEAFWDETYRDPRDVAGDVCDFTLARILELFELLVSFVIESTRRSVTLTWVDFAISEIEA